MAQEFVEIFQKAPPEKTPRLVAQRDKAAAMP